MFIHMTTDLLTVSFIPWNKKKLLHHGLCIFIILEAVKVRMANENNKIGRRVPQMAKLLGIDRVHEYINIITKGFSATVAYSIRQHLTDISIFLYDAICSSKHYSILESLLRILSSCLCFIF